MTDTIQQLKENIALLQEKLQKLEEIENHKTPCEKAYRDAYGFYPITDCMSGGSMDYVSWSAFQKGYNAAYEEKVSQEPEEQKWDAVRESVKWCEENPDKDPLDCFKRQTPMVPFHTKSKDDFIDKMVAELKGQSLTDLIYDWWEDVFTTNSNDDMETCIDSLVTKIAEWLPKEQFANSQNTYVECTVEGFNDCLQKIKRKLK